MKSYDWKYIFKKLVIFFIIFAILSFIKSCNVHAATVEGCIDSGDSLKGIAKIGTNYVGSGYYEWASQTWNNQNLNVTFCTDLKDHDTQTGKQTINFTVDYCVNGSKPDFAIYSSYYNDIDYTYYLNTSIYLAEGEWSKAYCYRSFIKIRLNYTDNVGTGNYNFTQYTQDNNVFAMYGFDNFNKLVRYNDLVYYNANDYNSALDQAKIIGQNNEIIQGQQDIINNQTNNTNSIINNQDNNTQHIIDNQTQNTQAEIESQKVCQYIDKNSITVDNRYLSSTGVESYSGNFGVSDYISVNSSSDITILSLSESASYVCFYNVNYTLLSCVSSLNNGLGDLLIPNGSSYVRFTINKSLNKPTYNVCKNGNQAMNDSINDLNDNINDDNVSGAESQVNDLLNNSSFQDNSGIQSIITAPLNFIQGLTNTCSPISLIIPYINTNVTIPCMKQELTNRVPTVVPILSTIINGFIIYRILLDIVGIVKSAREPDEDRIEVLDL